MPTPINRRNHDVHCKFWMDRKQCNCWQDQIEPKHELDNDLPAFLVFEVLRSIRSLKKLQPNHILVKAVEHALDQAAQSTELEDRRTNDCAVALRKGR